MFWFLRDGDGGIFCGGLMQIHWAFSAWGVFDLLWWVRRLMQTPRAWGVFSLRADGWWFIQKIVLKFLFNTWSVYQQYPGWSEIIVNTLTINMLTFLLLLLSSIPYNLIEFNLQSYNQSISLFLPILFPHNITILYLVYITITHNTQYHILIYSLYILYSITFNSIVLN